MSRWRSTACPSGTGCCPRCIRRPRPTRCLGPTAPDTRWIRWTGCDLATATPLIAVILPTTKKPGSPARSSPKTAWTLPTTSGEPAESEPSEAPRQADRGNAAGPQPDAGELAAHPRRARGLIPERRPDGTVERVLAEIDRRADGIGRRGRTLGRGPHRGRARGGRDHERAQDAGDHVCGQARRAGEAHGTTSYGDGAEERAVPYRPVTRAERSVRAARRGRKTVRCDRATPCGAVDRRCGTDGRDIPQRG